MSTHLNDCDYKLDYTEKDGYCFISSLRKCLLHDHSEMYSNDVIGCLITSEIFNNNQYYKRYYSGNLESMLRSLDNYIKHGVYSQQVVDIVVLAAAKCLSVNLCIYKKYGDNAILYMQPSNPPSTRDIYLQYNDEHYDAIVSKNSLSPNQKQKIIEVSDLLSNEDLQYLNKLGYLVSIEGVSDDMLKTNTDYLQSSQSTPIDNHSENVQSDNPTITDSFLTRSIANKKDHNEDVPGYIPTVVPDKYLFQDDYSGEDDAVHNNAATQKTSKKCTEPDMIDLTKKKEDESYESGNVNSDSVSSIFSDSYSHSAGRIKPRKYSKGKINENRFAKVAPESVDAIPWDINGNKIYRLKCKEKDYISHYQDGRWFVLKDSTRKGLNGYRKTGPCHGSLICTRPDCSKLATDDVVNTIDFKRKGNDIWECGSCGWNVQRIYCGCRKVVEYDIDKELLTYQHEGMHICALKPNVKERRKALDTLPIPLSGTSKPLQYMKDCMQFHLDSGNIDEAFQIPKAVCHSDVVDRIKQMRTFPNRSIHCNDELDAFGHVKRIHDSILKAKKDKYLIYEWDCKSMGNKHSYVFKTSEMSMKIAALMAGKIKVGGQDSLLVEEPAYFDGMHSRVKYFVSLTLWVFHPAMRGMVILAIMDALKEDSDNIKIFFDIFTKAVAHYINEPEYIWDPHYIMMDQKGANFEAIEHVFGAEFW